MIYVIVMLVALLFCAKYNGIMDSIMFYRTHLGQHPYRDYWHLCKHITRIGLLLSGAMVVLAEWLSLIILLSLPTLYNVWKYHAYAEPREKYYDVDETLKISTGIDWLDKILGFHH